MEYEEGVGRYSLEWGFTFEPTNVSQKALKLEVFTGI